MMHLWYKRCTISWFERHYNKNDKKRRQWRKMTISAEFTITMYGYDDSENKNNVEDIFKN